MSFMSVLYSALCLALALGSGAWARIAAGRTALIYTPSQFVEALADETVNKVQVEAPLVTLTEDVFKGAGMRRPLFINRTMSVVGGQMLPEWPMLQLFAWHMVELRAGVTMLFAEVMIQYTVTDSPARTPNLYLFAPSAAPNLGPNGTRVVLQDSVLILPSCLPAVLRNQNLVPVERPVWEGPGPQRSQFHSMGDSCKNSTDAPLLDRCWNAGIVLQEDMAYPGAESASDGTVVANNVTVRLVNTRILCRQEVSEDCIVSLGPYGCLVYTNRRMSTMPPAPISAQMLALLVAQQQQAMPGAAGNPPLPRPAGDRIPAADSAGGASTSTVLIGAIIGGVAGAALLLAAAAASVLFLRRKRFQQQQEHGRPPKPAFLSIPGFGMLHHARKKQQEEYDIKPSVLVMSDEPFATYSSETAAGCASPVAAAATPLPADGQQRPSGSQHLLKEVDSRRLANLITLSSPLREGLETTFMVMRESAADVPYSAALSGSIAEGCADEGAAAPADAPPTSGQGSLSRAPDVCALQQQPQLQCPTEAALAGSAALRATDAAAISNGAAADACTGQTAASAYASSVAALLLSNTNNVRNILAVSGGGVLPWSSSVGAAASPDACGGAAGSTAAAAEPAAAQAAGLARDEATEGAAGTPAAAVSLLPAQAPSEQQPHVEVAVVELLPHKLGKGAFGRVVEGRYRGQRVAVKQALDLHDGLTLPVEAIVASFLQEVQVMGRCTHPNITTLLAACLAPPKLCLVMEIMDTNLEALLYGGPPGQLLPLPTVLHIAIQVAQGLEYLHPTVIHRDLKPSNVLISNLDDEYPVVKLADFGLSKISEMTLQTVNPEAGSPCYLPPECFDVTNHMLTHKMDMYAFGVLLWTMLTGEVPWKNHNMVSVAYNVHTAGRRPPWDGVPDSRCPRKLHKLVEQCWDAQPRRRPAAAEVVKELLVIREQLLLASSGKLWVA